MQPSLAATSLQQVGGWVGGGGTLCTHTAEGNSPAGGAICRGGVGLAVFKGFPLHFERRKATKLI